MKFTPSEVIHAIRDRWSPTFIKGTLTTLWDEEDITLIVADGTWRNTKTGQRMPRYIQAEIAEYLESIRSTPSSANPSTPRT